MMAPFVHSNPDIFISYYNQGDWETVDVLGFDIIENLSQI